MEDIPSDFQKVYNTFYFAPHIGVFTFCFNCQISKYVSWSPYQKSVAIDVFSITLKILKFYAFPPFILVGEILSQMKKRSSICDHKYSLVGDSVWFSVMVAVWIFIRISETCHALCVIIFHFIVSHKFFLLCCLMAIGKYRYRTLCEECPYSELFWSVFPRIRTEYSPNAGKYRPEKLRIRILFTQWIFRHGHGHQKSWITLLLPQKASDLDS